MRHFPVSYLALPAKGWQCDRSRVTNELVQYLLGVCQLSPFFSAAVWAELSERVGGNGARKGNGLSKEVKKAPTISRLLSCRNERPLPLKQECVLFAMNAAASE